MSRCRNPVERASIGALVANHFLAVLLGMMVIALGQPVRAIPPPPVVTFDSAEISQTTDPMTISQH